MIQFKNVSKIYADGFQALDSINLHVKEGELLVLIGPSGCGKTTTMKMINRLSEPSSGEIFINKENITHLNPVNLRRNIGYVIQQIGLLPHMTIGQNVGLVPKLKRMDPSTYMKRVYELLDMVGLDPNIYVNRYPFELSGGQQQRVGVIRALAADPSIILMDEPFSALDPISREQLQDELVKLQDQIKKTIIFVTHDMDEALKIADRICIMEKGKIVQIDTPEQILRHPVNDFVRSFIGEERLSKVKLLPPVDEVMVRPITIRPDKGLAESIKIMRHYKVDSLLVVDKNDRFLGTVGVWQIQKNYENESLQMKDIMRTDVPTMHETESLKEAMDIFLNSNIRTLPVLSHSNELLGIITHASLVEIMAKKYANA